MNTPSERLEAFIKQVFKTKRAFAAYMGVDPTWATAYTKKVKPSIIQSQTIIEKLSLKGFNYHWYISGEGEMLLPVEIKTEQESRKENADVEAYINFKNIKDLHKLTPEQVKEMLDGLPDFEIKLKKLNKVYEEVE